VIAQKIVKKVLWLENLDDPFSFGKRLQSHPSGDIRFRIGDYRVIAVVDKKTKSIIITAIGHRREIYR